MVAFILLVLSSVLYDGVLTTPEWSAFERALAGSLAPLGSSAALVARTIGLGLAWAVFLGAYLVASAAMSLAARGRSTGEIARGFAFTLVPIAIAYHLAHYLSYLD